jgi:Fe-S-cluster-containing dehydrogenase component
MVINEIKADIMSRFEINIDHDLCWGCKTCEVACKQENRAADGVKLICVEEDGPRLIDDKLDFSFQVNLCRHCHGLRPVHRLPGLY